MRLPALICFLDHNKSKESSHIYRKTLLAHCMSDERDGSAHNKWGFICWHTPGREGVDTIMARVTRSRDEQRENQASKTQ